MARKQAQAVAVVEEAPIEEAVTPPAGIFNGRRWTQEQKDAHAAKMRQVFAPGTEARAKLQGRRLTDEQKDTIRQSLIAHYADGKVQGPMTGRRHSEETKLRLRVTMLLKFGKVKEAEEAQERLDALTS